MQLRRISIGLVAAALVAAATFATPRAATAAGPYTVYLPNITKTLGGQDGWHTPFIVQNIGSTTTSLTVSFYKFIDGSLVATRKADVLPGRSFVDSPRDDRDLPDNAQFSVVVTSSSAPVVALVNEHRGFDAGTEALSYSGVSEGATSVFVPIVYRMFDDWLTTLIIQNVGTASAEVTAFFFTTDGKKAASISRTIAPGRSQFIDPRVESALANGTQYSVSLGSNEPIAVIANGHHDIGDVQPQMGDSYNGVLASTSTTSYLPYLPMHTDGNGPFSRLYVQNAGSSNAIPMIQFRTYAGDVPQDLAPVVKGQIMPPGTVWVLTPPLPNGEYSATITGGTFAAVVVATTFQTAMQYTSTSAPASKIFLPNITRRLGPPGDPGWTTPIYLQSATATGATLKWYRFDDGSLVTTQTLQVKPGTVTRVDPAAVSGLADNTQYAVVIEATGTLVAIVTELNPIGSDDAMIYKGFPAPQ